MIEGLVMERPQVETNNIREETAKPSTTIAWLDGCRLYQYVEEIDIETLGVGIEWYEAAIPAIMDVPPKRHCLLSQQYPLILMNLVVVGGVRGAHYNDNRRKPYRDQVIDEIMAGEQIDYEQIGLYVIRKVREEKSANKDTPVLVYLDDKTESAQRLKVLESGANNFFLTADQRFHENFIAEIKRLLGI